MRLDRAITLNLVCPLRQIQPRTSDQKLPILMYHSVSGQDEPLASYYVTNTRPSVFREQMCFLREHGYLGVSLDQGLDWLNAPQPNIGSRKSEIGNRKPVVLTFDDGFQDFHTTAAPVLREFGFTATMFLPTGLIDQERGQFKGRPCLTWPEVRTLAAAGIRFGSHTVSHPRLYGMKWSEIEAELAGSKYRLEQMLGDNATTFAYPFAYPQADAEFTAQFESLLACLGYCCNVTTCIGRVWSTDNLFSLRRLPMNSFDDETLLAAKLAGHYDWLAAPQAAIKKLKQTLRLARRSGVLPVSDPQSAASRP